MEPCPETTVWTKQPVTHYSCHFFQFYRLLVAQKLCSSNYGCMVNCQHLYSTRVIMCSLGTGEKDFIWCGRWQLWQDIKLMEMKWKNCDFLWKCLGGSASVIDAESWFLLEKVYRFEAIWTTCHCCMFTFVLLNFLFDLFSSHFGC